MPEAVEAVETEKSKLFPDTIPEGKITHRDLREIDAALREWGSRTLPNLQSDLKVSALRRRFFKGPTEDINRAQDKLVREIPLPEDIEAMKIPPSISEARGNRFNVEVLDVLVDIPKVPDKLKLTAKDLPKDMKDDPDNRAGIANILAALPNWLLDMPELTNIDEE